MPKSPKVLLLENIHPEAAKKFAEAGYQVKTATGAMNADELIDQLPGIHMLGIRSRTQITAQVLRQAEDLLVIGAFCIGVNQIDLQAGLQHGVAVFNAPYGNTRSVVELVMGELVMLMRRVTDKSRDLHQGKWSKTAEGSYELRGKKLGIIGYGNIGSQVSTLAEAFGMQVYFYDVFDKLALGNAVRCESLEELLQTVDAVTIHVDGAKDNTHLIGRSELEMMKPGALLLNLSRGHIVDIPALAKSLKNGHLGGASVDVYPVEPKRNQDPFSSELQDLPNVILTPHIGGSTQEAQSAIGGFVAGKMHKYMITGDTSLSVNFPEVRLSHAEDTYRFVHVHNNVPGILAKVNKVLAKNKINVEGQYLKTNEQVGYVITESNKPCKAEAVKELQSIPETIKFRTLY